MDNLIGRRFHVPTRNETRGTRGVYQGVILEENKWGAAPGRADLAGGTALRDANADCLLPGRKTCSSRLGNTRRAQKLERRTLEV